MIVEVCASNFESAIAAEHGGAHRIELCTSLEVGGLTPSEELLRKVISEISIPVHVLVRPSAGGFIYSEEDIRDMLETIDHCRSLGCKGIVSGALTAEGNIDVAKTAQLKEASTSLHFTFHRAFDLCNDPFAAVEQLVGLQVDTLLTSGQKPTAVEGLPLLEKLNDQFSKHIKIMPGAGINDGNAARFRDSGFSAIHLSAIVKEATEYTDLMKNARGISDVDMIRKVVALLT